MLKEVRQMQTKPKNLYELKKAFSIICFFVIVINSFEFTSAKVTKISPQKSKPLSTKEIPRKDLYEQIKRTTGVSLKRLFHLVFQRGSAKNRQSTFKKLSKYVNKKETQQLIDQGYQQRIQEMNAYCNKNQKTCRLLLTSW